MSNSSGGKLAAKSSLHDRNFSVSQPARPGRRVGQPVRGGHRLGRLQLQVATLAALPVLHGGEEVALGRRQVGRVDRGRPPQRQVGEVQARDPIRVDQRQVLRRPATDVAAGHHVPVVAERGHQPGDLLGHDLPAGPADRGRVGEAVAGQGRNDDRVVRQQRQCRDEAQERVRPAVQQQQRNPTAGLLVHEVQAVRPEVRQFVELGLVPPPVVAGPPVVEQLAQEVGVGAAIPAHARGGDRPPGDRQPGAQVGQHGVGHVDPVRLHAGQSAGRARTAYATVAMSARATITAA